MPGRGAASSATPRGPMPLTAQGSLSRRSRGRSFLSADQEEVVHSFGVGHAVNSALAHRKAMPGKFLEQLFGPVSTPMPDCETREQTSGQVLNDSGPIRRASAHSVSQNSRFAAMSSGSLHCRGFIDFIPTLPPATTGVGVASEQVGQLPACFYQNRACHVVAASPEFHRHGAARWPCSRPGSCG